MAAYETQTLQQSLQSPLNTNLSSSDLSSPLESIVSLAKLQSSYSASTPGVFMVSTSGKVSIDYLFDSGSYEGEVGIFKLSGLEQFVPNSQKFIREATRRALSNSNEGYVVISDIRESAQYSGRFDWESAYNSGRYGGAKTFAMNAGDLFAIMLVPNGTIQEVFNNPSLEGAKRPVFSVSASNPNSATHIVGLKSLEPNGQILGIEDLREDGASDFDFNDIIFYMDGATGQTVPIDNVIFSQYSWRTTDVGKQLLEFAPPKTKAPWLTDKTRGEKQNPVI